MNKRPTLTYPDQDIPAQAPDRGEQQQQGIYQRSWWWLVSVLAVGLVLGIGGLEVVRMLARPLALIILAVSIAAALAPLVERLEKRIPRALAVILVYTVLGLAFFGVLTTTVPPLVQQTRALVDSSNTWFPKIAFYLGQMGLDTTNLGSAIFSEMSRYSSFFLMLPIGLVAAVIQTVLVIFLSLYWLISMRNLKQFVLSFFSADRSDTVSALITQMGENMGGYLRGSAINGLILGTLKYIGLLIIGVPYALTLGTLAAMTEFFPTIGPIISGTVATLVALSVSPHLALITLIYAVVLQQTEGHILVPLIMRSQTKISPLLAIFAIAAGAAIGGLLGALIAIPTASALHVLAKMVIAPAIRRANGAEPQ